MKKLIILTLLSIILLSCVRVKPELKSVTAMPQFLESVQVEKKDEKKIEEELKALHTLPIKKYTIGAEDVFDIFVYDEEELTTMGVMVKSDGTISLKLIPDLHVEGLTIPEASTKIEKALSEYIRHPQVTMKAVQLTSSSVTILGKITRPGRVVLDGDMRILDAIAEGGGLAVGYFQNNTTELADLERTYLLRNGRILPIDFMELIKNGNMLYNIPLADKDYIYIPSAINREIYVLGEVNTQGHYAFKENMTLMQIISFANGFRPTAKRTVYVIRGNLSHPRLFKIDTKAVMRAEVQDFPLKPNDIVFVPASLFANWNEVLDLVIPSLNAIQGYYIVNDLINDN